MKFKIVVDSSSNLLNSYIKDKEVGFEVVPLIININGKEFVDDDNIDTEAMLAEFHSTKEKATTSCPSPGRFMQAYEEADNIICVTITSHLSGTFNSAVLAGKDLAGKNVHVIDSMSVAGTMQLIVDKAYELIKEGYEYAQLVEALNKYRDSLNLLYVLDSFENLVRNGRMNKAVALIAKTLRIKPLCIAENGQIKIQQKIRTYDAAIKRMNMVMKDLCDISKLTRAILTYVDDKIKAVEIKELIEKTYPNIKVLVSKAKGLTSFYALENGIMLGF
ncbi:MAG: DegV family protein [Bacilli bacterium]